MSFQIKFLKEDFTLLIPQREAWHSKKKEIVFDDGCYHDTSFLANNKETASTYKINDPSRRLTTVNTSSKLLAIPRENAFTRKLIQTALEKQIDRAN